MESSLLFVLAASLAGVAAAAPAAGSICHVLTYTGACGNLTSLSSQPANSSTSSNSSSSSSDSCTYASICLVPSICNSTQLTSSVDALTGAALISGSGNDTLPANTTGCVSFSDFGMQMDSLAVCDGNRYLINGTDSAYRCICNDSPDSCPEQGTAISISYANGTSSTSAASPNQPSQFSWTWGASSASTTRTASASASTGRSASPSTIAARTTFTFTFGGGNASSSMASTPAATAGIGGVQGQPQNDASVGAGAKLTAGLTVLATAACLAVAPLLL